MLEDLQIRNAPTTIAAYLPSRRCRIRQAFWEAARPTRPRAHSAAVPTVSEPAEARVSVPLHPGRLGTPVFLHPHAAPADRHRTHSLAQVRKEAADRLEPAGSQSAAGSAQKPRPPHHAVHDVCRRT